MARKHHPLARVLGGQAVAAIIYGAVASSLYFALGVTSLWALGLTPLILLGAGALFALVATAYAEASAAYGEPGGAAGVARRAFGEAAGFVVGWLVLLDFAVVIGLSLLFVPSYVAAAVGSHGSLEGHIEEVIAVILAAAIAVWHVGGRRLLVQVTIITAITDLIVQVLLAVAGLALVFDSSRLDDAIDVGTKPTVDALVFAVPIALLAFTGIEVVAALIRQTSAAPAAVARRSIAALGTTLVLYVVIAAVALSAFPVEPAPGTPSGAASAISTTWLDAPLAGLAERIGDELTTSVGTILRAVVGVAGAATLLATAMVAFVGATRLVETLGDMSALPDLLARRSRRTGVSLPAAVMMVILVASLLGIASLYDDEASGLAGIYSFGILVAAMAVFAGVVALRAAEPDTPRPLRMPLEVAFGRLKVPLTAVLGLFLAWAVWLLALRSHPAVRVVPPAWLALGLVGYVLHRRARGLPLYRGERRGAPPVVPELAEVLYGTIVVPMKQAGPIEDEMLASAAKLASDEPGCRVIGVLACEVPLDLELDAHIDGWEERVAECEAVCAQFKKDYGVSVELRALRTRAISATLVAEARALGAGLILVGAVPHPARRAGRAEIFSDTVENLLRRAHCRVIVTAFPVGTASVAEPDPVPATRGQAHAHDKEPT